MARRYTALGLLSLSLSLSPCRGGERTANGGGFNVFNLIPRVRVQQHENFSPGGIESGSLGDFCIVQLAGGCNSPFRGMLRRDRSLFSPFHLSQSDLRSLFFKFLFFFFFFLFGEDSWWSSRFYFCSFIPSDRVSRFIGSRTRSRVILKNGTRTDDRSFSLFTNFPRLKMVFANAQLQRSFLSANRRTLVTPSLRRIVNRPSKDAQGHPKTARLAQPQPSFPRRAKCSSRGACIAINHTFLHNRNHLVFVGDRTQLSPQTKTAHGPLAANLHS